MSAQLNTVDAPPLGAGEGLVGKREGQGGQQRKLGENIGDERLKKASHLASRQHRGVPPEPVQVPSLSSGGANRAVQASLLMGLLVAGPLEKLRVNEPSFFHRFRGRTGLGS